MKLLAALPILLAAGCTTATVGAPSLAPRAAEKVGFDEPAAAAPAPVVADPALDARLAEWDAKLGAIAKGYDADAAKAERAAKVAGAAAVGSDAWLTAQTALAALDDWRAQASGLATDLEAAGGERAATVGSPYPALDALRSRAAAEAEREATGIATIGARLPLP